MSMFKKVFNILGFQLAWWSFAFLMGELYQNNHHKAHRKINFANRWFEIDLGYLFAFFLQKLNIVKINKAT